MITTKMFKNRNYNNASQKRLAKFALIKYHINLRNYGLSFLTKLISNLGNCSKTIVIPLKFEK